MGYKSIVCGVTGSEHAKKAALEAAILAKADKADLTYVYAVDLAFLKGGKTGSATTQGVEQSLENVGRLILDGVEQIAWIQAVNPRKVLMKGPVQDVLKKVIIEQEADLLVLGHEERTFFEKFLFEGDVEDHIERLKKETGVEVMVVK
jgi:nucleotide-binding universal stress UspA family protein